MRSRPPRNVWRLRAQFTSKQRVHCPLRCFFQLVHEPKLAISFAPVFVTLFENVVYNKRQADTTLRKMHCRDRRKLKRPVCKYVLPSVIRSVFETLVEHVVERIVRRLDFNCDGLVGPTTSSARDRWVTMNVALPPVLFRRVRTRLPRLDSQGETKTRSFYNVSLPCRARRNRRPQAAARLASESESPISSDALRSMSHFCRAL